MPLWAAYYQGDSPGERPQSSQQPQPGPQVAAVPEQDPAAAPYQANCEGPQSREDADLCAQRRMADAAERLNGQTQNQFWLQIGELFFLIAAFASASTAAIASVKSAQHARDQIGVTRAMARAELKVRPGGVSGVAADQLAKSTVQFDNVGPTRADVISLRMGIFTARWPVAPADEQAIIAAQRSDARLDEVAANITVATGDDKKILGENNEPFSSEVISELQSGTRTIFVAGFIRYRDIFGTRITRYFLHRYGIDNLSAEGGLYHWTGNETEIETGDKGHSA